MKNLVLSLTMIVAIAATSQAAVWRVNNITGTDADFTSAQSAHNNQYVMAGDTLYIEPSTANYGDLTLTKKLVIIGNGYFPAQNPETQANPNYSRLDVVTFNSGSQGSIIQGCLIYYIMLNTSEIIIQRNYVSYNDRHVAPIIFNSTNISNVIIRNNYLKNSGSHYSYRFDVIRSEESGVNNIFIYNNLIYSSNLDHGYAIYTNDYFTGEIRNNVIYGNLKIRNSQFNNNILRDGTFSKSNTTYYNNIGNSDQFGNEYGNQSNVNMLNVFVGEGSTDGQFQLKEGSPAIGAGVGGIDCGMFGGDFPYVLSGIPAIPSVYEFSHDIDYDNQQIEVEISVKSHN